MIRKSAFVAAALAAAAFTFAPMPAFAHDEVVSTSPAADSSVAAGPLTVSVTFNEDIMQMQDNSGEVIEVTGPDGTDAATWSNGCVSVSGATESTDVDLDAPGLYTVNWRSVSNDGHANEGSFTFTVTNDNDYKSGGLVEPSAECATATPDAVAYSTKTLGSGNEPTDEERTFVSGTAKASNPFVANLPYLIGGMVLVLLGAFAGPAIKKLRAAPASAESTESKDGE
jgi:methionine-rich copper-binding protein CopC